MAGGLYRPLSESDIQQIHATVVAILSEVGLRHFHNLYRDALGDTYE